MPDTPGSLALFLRDGEKERTLLLECGEDGKIRVREWDAAHDALRPLERLESVDAIRALLDDAERERFTVRPSRADVERWLADVQRASEAAR